jgi:hypothetical protein
VAQVVQCLLFKLLLCKDKALSSESQSYQNPSKKKQKTNFGCMAQVVEALSSNSNTLMDTWKDHGYKSWNLENSAARQALAQAV